MCTYIETQSILYKFIENEGVRLTREEEEEEERVRGREKSLVRVVNEIFILMTRCVLMCPMVECAQMASF